MTRSSGYEDDFSQIHDKILSADTDELIDDQPTPHEANYYQVHVADTSGNVSKGMIGLGYWNDQEPPAAPTGLSGKIDSLGNVFLIWEPGDEPDLHGYRVYVSHAKNREFLQVNEDIVRQNYFFDSTRLQTLNETMYYRLVALDNNFNPSEYGEIVAIKRPDKVAPSAAVITEYSARGDAIHLTWQPSASKDVVEQSIWRTSAETGWERLITLGRSAKNYIDTTTNARTHYQYKVRTSDDASLFTDSKSMEILSGLRSVRDDVIKLWTDQNDNEYVLKWEVDAEIAESIIYHAQPDNDLRPLRRVSAPVDSWTLMGKQKLVDRWAIQIIYSDGSRSSIVELQ